MPLRVQTHADARGPTHGSPARAGVSSFGFGGTNAHVILEAAAPAGDVTPPPSGRAEILPLSARSRTSLEGIAREWDAYLAGDEASIAEACYTASVRRDASPSPIRGGGPVRRGDPGATPEHSGRGCREPGPRWARFRGSGPGWRSSSPAKAHSGGRWGASCSGPSRCSGRSSKECDEVLHRLGGWSLLEELGAAEGASRLARTDIAQPAIFALQAGLVDAVARLGSPTGRGGRPQHWGDRGGVRRLRAVARRGRRDRAPPRAVDARDGGPGPDGGGRADAGRREEGAPRI